MRRMLLYQIYRARAELLLRAPYFQILVAFWHILQLLNIPEYLTRAGSNKLDVWVKYL
jgi:hypothetical protein